MKRLRSNYKIIYGVSAEYFPTFNGLKEKVLSLDVRDLMSTAETVDSRSFLWVLLAFRSDMAPI